MVSQVALRAPVVATAVAGCGLWLGLNQPKVQVFVVDPHTANVLTELFAVCCLKLHDDELLCRICRCARVPICTLLLAGDDVEVDRAAQGRVRYLVLGCRLVPMRRTSQTYHPLTGVVGTLSELR